MEKRKNNFYKLFVFIITLAVCLGSVGFNGLANINSQSAETVEHSILYSVNNAPIFYGATKITIDKNVTTSFNIKDSRFRIYAKDFEDGDISSKIECVYNNVNPTVAGSYEIKYKVKDSHNNETKITVPVTILDKTDGECTIERTLYTLQSDWNITLIGVGRNRNGDRQNLGIYMPADTTAKIRVVEADSNFVVWMLGNYETKETNFTLNKTQSEYKVFENKKNNVSYSCVPFVGSVIQAEGESVNKTYKIEINFDSSVKPLDYYLYKDNEDEFMASWKASESDFGVIDCQAMQILVPFMDIDKISKKTYASAIGTLDESLEYFMKVIDRMDEILGVSINPDTPLNQNVRIKNFIKANGNKTSIGAYYTNNHIGIGSASAWPVFTYGWGTLHECGHGYQGYLGQGSGKGLNMCLNETGNNVFAYYVQRDKSIYKSPNNNVGELKDIENSRNSKRINGEEIFNNNNGTYTNVDEKLYMIVNMLETFDGYKTYAKLYSYFRKLVYNEGINAYTIPEVYAKFFADEYNVNIMPYLFAWKLPVGSNVAYEIMQRNLKNFSILSDTVGESNLQNIKDNENLTLSYGLVDDETLLKYDIKGNLKVTLNLIDLNAIKGKYVALFKKGELIEKVKITSNEINFENINVGIYEVRLPVVYDYDNDSLVLNVNSGNNSATYSYTKTTNDYLDRSQKIIQLGYYRYGGSIGFSIELSNHNKLATIEYGGGLLLNQSGEWLTTKANDTFISFKILDTADNIVFEKSVKGNKEYFTSQGSPENPNINVDYGYKIEIYTEMPTYVRVKSVDTDAEIPEYNTNSKNISYEITKYGLKLLNAENFDEQTILYNHTKANATEFIEEYKNSVTYGEIVNKRINAKKKVEVISAYNSLSEEDRLPYTEFINKIKAGGSPIVKQIQSVISIKPKEDIDLYSLIEIFDNEDIIIDSNSSNVAFNTNFNNKKAGVYVVTYTITDSDGNIANYKLAIAVENASPNVVFIVATILAVVLLTVTVLVVVKRRKAIKNN